MSNYRVAVVGCGSRRMIRETADLIDRQITHILPMSRVQEAWEIQLSGNCGKVLLKPGI